MSDTKVLIKSANIIHVSAEHPRELNFLIPMFGIVKYESDTLTTHSLEHTHTHDG